MKQIPYWEPTDISRQRKKKFIQHDDMAPWISAHLGNLTYFRGFPQFLYENVSTSMSFKWSLCIRFPHQNPIYISFTPISGPE
jgi:hypothetical protein